MHPGRPRVAVRGAVRGAERGKSLVDGFDDGFTKALFFLKILLLFIFSYFVFVCLNDIYWIHLKFDLDTWIRIYEEYWFLFVVSLILWFVGDLSLIWL